MVRLTDRPDMTLDVYRGRKTTMQQQQPLLFHYQKEDDKIFVCQFSRNVKSKLYHIDQNSKTRGQTV